MNKQVLRILERRKHGSVTLGGGDSSLLCL